ncbi:MAG: DUF6531 domain-containing protein [Mariprofundus sp.]
MSTLKRSLFFLLTCMGCIALPLAATADIDGGNYMVSYNDYVSPDQSIVLGRTYNSVTQTSGQLGHGWGASFETYVTVVGDGTVIFHLNRTGSQTIFHTPQRKLADLKASIKSILAAREKSPQPMQFSMRNADGEKVVRAESTLSEYLLKHRALRYFLWEHYVDKGLLAEAELPTGTKLIAHSSYGDVELTSTSAGYRVLNGFGVYDFDRHGRLVAYSDHESLNKGKLDARFYWGQGKQLLAVASKKSDTMIFVRRNDQGLITGLLDQQGHPLASYQYKGENMVYAKDHGDHAYQYHYNEDDHMDTITYSNGSTRSIIYDEDGNALRTTARTK